MRKVMAAEFVSLDGYVAGPNGEMDWGPTELSPRDLEPEWDTILLGRVTYQLWCGLWPEVTAEENPLAEFINRAPKVVFSKTLAKAPWGKWPSARLVREGVPAAISAMKREEGGNMAILGSAGLVQSLANLGLIDEYLLLVFPTILGGGRELFGGMVARRRLELLESRSMENGVVVLRYRSAPAERRLSVAMSVTEVSK